MAPAVAADASGRFVIAWQSEDRVVFRRFAADGTALDGADVAVDAAAAGAQRNPAVTASTSSGAFLVAWQGSGAAADASSFGVYARAFAEDGSPAGAAAAVNQTTAGAQHSPAVTYTLGLPATFVAVWQSQGQDGSGGGIYQRRLSLAGVPLASEEPVAATTAGSQRRPQVASDASGNAVIVWESQGTDGTTLVRGRRFRGSGAPIGGEVQLSSSVLPGSPAVASALGGDFLAAWARAAEDGELDLLRRGFDHRGVAFESEQAVSATAGAQQLAAAAAGGPTQTVVAWVHTASGQPPAVVAQRFAVGGSDFFTATPCRLVDTRNATGPLGGPQLSAGVARTFTIAAVVCGVPATARALALNVTAVPGVAAGDLVVYPGDLWPPGTNVVSYLGGVNRAAMAVVPLSRDGIGTFTALSTANVHLVVDVNGWWE